MIYMKSKILFPVLFVTLICVVITVACLNTTTINPLHKKIESFSSSFPENAPLGDDIILYMVGVNYSMVAPHSNQSLISNSDIAFYGTLTSINPSVWTTANQNPPPGLSESSLGSVSFRLENGTIVQYRTVQVVGCSDYICTTVVFEVDYLIKGENATEVAVIIPSGKVDNYISLDPYYRYATPWDLEIGQQYIVYLEDYDTETKTLMVPGLFVIIE